VSFALAVKTCFKKYFDFSGRASRPEYWWFFLGCILALAVSLLVAAELAAALGTEEAESGIAFALLPLAILLGLLLPQLAVTVRRLHDTGRSGAWYFISFIPFVGAVILLILLAQEGGEQNQYGPPRGIGSSSDRAQRSPAT
jgi:uncharacterized membrane protein YhaH (DUF805 family)